MCRGPPGCRHPGTPRLAPAQLAVRATPEGHAAATPVFSHEVHRGEIHGRVVWLHAHAAAGEHLLSVLDWLQGHDWGGPAFNWLLWCVGLSREPARLPEDGSHFALQTGECLIHHRWLNAHDLRPGLIAAQKTT